MRALKHLVTMIDTYNARLLPFFFVFDRFSSLNFEWSLLNSCLVLPWPITLTIDAPKDVLSPYVGGSSTSMTM